MVVWALAFWERLQGALVRVGWSLVPAEVFGLEWDACFEVVGGFAS